MIRILQTKKASAEENMSLDTKLLDELEPNDSPILHFYEWALPSATYGHFIDPNRFFAAENKISIARRATGGGIIFHTCDLAFSLLIPAKHPKFSVNTMENYALVNRAVISAIESWAGEREKLSLLNEAPLDPSNSLHSFCMAHPTRYDVILHGKKVGGAAQRRKKQGLLHHGTISLGLPSEELLLNALIEGDRVIRSIRKSSRSLLGENWSQKELALAREKMKLKLIDSLKKAL